MCLKGYGLHGHLHSTDLRPFVTSSTTYIVGGPSFTLALPDNNYGVTGCSATLAATSHSRLASYETDTE